MAAETMRWYRAWADGDEDLYTLTIEQIEAFGSDANQRDLTA